MDASAPDATTLDASAPDATTLDASGPDATALDASAPTLPVAVGYYAEDPTTNPEDPTVGTILLTIPASDGPFTGQLPFSYVGCSTGTDVASLTGTRSGASLTGTWSGVLDGVSVSGGFSVTRDAASARWDGTFTTTGGKTFISVPPCGYYVAGNGTIRIFDAPTNEPPSFAATATASITPTLTWPSLGAGVGYLVRVFDVDCVAATPGSSACFMGETVVFTGSSVSYPTSFAGAASLRAGGTYVVTVTALRIGGALQGFSTVVIRP